MAIKDMLLPELAESVVEGEILKWMVEEGDTIALEQPIVEVMTDKVTVELPATFAGKLFKKLVKEGDVVAVHAPIAQIDDGVGGAASSAPSSADSSAAVVPAGAASTATPAATATLENADMAAVTSNEGQKSSALGADMSADSSAVGSAYDGGVKKATSMDFGGVAKGGPGAATPAAAGTNKFGRALATPAARQNAREAGVDIMTLPLLNLFRLLLPPCLQRPALSPRAARFWTFPRPNTKRPKATKPVKSACRCGECGKLFLERWSPATYTPFAPSPWTRPT